MRILIIGATGHIGGYLVPRLVEAGHDVIALSRGGKPRYRDDAAWQRVTTVTADRDAEDAAGTFGERVAALAPDVVVDLVCFTAESASQLVEAIRSRVRLLVMCSTIWVHGTPTAVPTDEDEDLAPWGDYGTGKLAIERLLAQESARPGGLPSISLRPGHISGPGWPITASVTLSSRISSRSSQDQALFDGRCAQLSARLAVRVSTPFSPRATNQSKAPPRALPSPIWRSAAAVTP